MIVFSSDAEKAARQSVVQNTVQAHPEVKPVKPATSFPDYHVKPENKVSADFSKPEMKPEFIKPMAPSKPVVTPAVTNVVRTLFTDGNFKFIFLFEGSARVVVEILHQSYNSYNDLMKVFCALIYYLYQISYKVLT